MLAISGGPPACPHGPPTWPRPSEQVRQALDACYSTGDWGRYHGRFTTQLIDLLERRYPARQVTLCSSGTVAVELALRGLAVGPGDEVLLSAYDFAGNFRAIEAVGASPVLVDVREEDSQLDVAMAAAAVGPQSKAVIASHLHGGLVDLRALCAVAQRSGLAVVEDACQCPGAQLAGKSVGSWGDVSVWSFGGSKLLTAGRGGALFTQDPQVHQRIKVAQTRGNDAYPLSELQAAVLIPQLEQLPQDHRQRLQSANQLTEQLAPLSGIRLLAPPLPESEPGFYKLGMLFEPSAFADLDRSQFLAAMQAEGVAIDAGFRGFVRRRRCRQAGKLTNAQIASANMLVLHHPVLVAGDEFVDRVATAFAKVVGHYATDHSR